MKGVVVSSSPQPLLFFSHTIPSSQSQVSVKTHQHRPTNTPFICLSSSSPSGFSSVVEQQQEDSLPLPSSPSAADFAADNVDPDALPLSGCKACGRQEIERGCNGEGRIQGGIATIPGFRWWPIKAYRPCPGFVASGGNYRRQGQSMDEVAFGGGRGADEFDEFGKRKGTDRRKFKR